jgi:LCP family protein required for cell wall assembly
MRQGSARRYGYRPAGRRASWYARHFARWHHLGLMSKIGYMAATFSAVVGVTAGVGGYALYYNVAHKVQTVGVGGLTGRTIYGPLNILVLGSQQRTGQQGFFGVAPGDSPETENSDNLLLIHLDATHTHATILSIPRDTFVYEPSCKDRSRFIGIGKYPAQAYPPGAIIDGALNIGGPTCAVETVEDLTGIKLDHFVMFDFNSFRTLVDALGGVEVCVPPGGYHDTNSGVNLKPGKHLLKYDEALAYVRQRDDLGGPDAGGDLPRIVVQQAFISSVIQKVNSTGLLSNGLELYKIASTAASALTVDKSLGNTSSLLGLARSLVHLKSQNVSLITMPTTVDTFDFPNYDEHLMTLEPYDDVLFGMILRDQDWNGHLPVEPYNKVQVRVYNGTGVAGLAARTAASLRKLGFKVIKIGNAPFTAKTTVQYSGIDPADSAYTVMTALKGTTAGQNLLQEPRNQVGHPGPVNLILGANFAGVNPPAPKHTAEAGKSKADKDHKSSSGGTTAAAASSSQNGAVESRNASENICAGLPAPIK